MAKPSNSRYRWFLGLAQASMFSLVYLLSPIYILSAIVAIVCEYPTRSNAWIYATPFLLSTFSKPVALPNFIANYLKPMSEYFQFDSISEMSDEELLQEIQAKKNFIIAAQPHGVVSTNFIRYDGILIIVDIHSLKSFFYN